MNDLPGPNTEATPDDPLERLLRTPDPALAPSARHDAAVAAARDRAVRRIRSRRRRVVWPPLALAASLLVAVGLLVRPASVDEASNIVTRGQMAGTVVPANASRLAEAPRQFAWPSVAGAKHYTVLLKHVSGETLWQAETASETGIELPEAVRARLLPGNTYLWQIVVEFPDRRSELNPSWFEVID